jgi:hypothetical protein
MDDLVQTAMDLLTAAGQYAPPVDVYALVSALGLCLRRVSLPRDVYGLLVRGIFGPYCLVNPAYPERLKFTVAHEVAHHVLGHPGEVIWLWRGDPRTPLEWQAQACAVEILMPSIWIRQEWDRCGQNFGAMMARFGVCRVAMDWRLRDVCGALPPRLRVR